MKPLNEILKYIKNYRSRHGNNVNLVLHIVGIPEAVFGLLQILAGKWKIGLLNIFLGYLWQWIGHTYFEKDEMGEIIGIKKLVKKFRGQV